MRNIRFGWRLPAFPFNGSRRATFIQEITNTLHTVNGAFDSVWVADHFVPWSDVIDNEVDTLEAWTTISYFAGAFPDLTFGSIVLSQSYRNPAYLAKAAATLQLLSGGRFILGIGAGWKDDEYLAYDYEFPKASVRIGQLSDAVQIIRKLWTETPADFEGKYYSIKGAYCEPKPDPMIPIMIGGGGEKLTLRVVAKHADWWNLGGSAEEYSHKLDVLKSHCEAVGRDFDSITKTWAGETIIATKTEAEARKIADANPLIKAAEDVVIYTPEQNIAHFQELIDLGVDYFILRFADFPDTASVELFAKEVIPQLKANN